MAINRLDLVLVASYDMPFECEWVDGGFLYYFLMLIVSWRIGEGEKTMKLIFLGVVDRSTKPNAGNSLFVC